MFDRSGRWMALIAAGAAVCGAAHAQDVVVMRRVVSPPRPASTPTPTPAVVTEIRNGGFEGGSTDWSFSGGTLVDASTVRSGSKAGYFPGSGTTKGAYVSQVVQTTVGRSYTVGGYVYQFGIAELGLYADGVKLAGTSVGNGGNGAWFYRSGTFTATATTTVIKVVKENTYTGRTAVDDLTISG